MNALIAEHPEAVQLIMLILAGIVVYFYKQNESKSAKLIANKLDQIVDNLKRLFDRDDQKTEAIMEISERMVAQEQRCDDREKHCPGIMAQKRLNK